VHFISEFDRETIGLAQKKSYPLWFQKCIKLHFEQSADAAKQAGAGRLDILKRFSEHCLLNLIISNPSRGRDVSIKKLK